MRIVSLVFSYDFDRMKSSGRVWSHMGYKSKDYIQSYSAASIATFLHHNPEKEYIHWPNRTPIIDNQIEKITAITRYYERV